MRQCLAVGLHYLVALRIALIDENKYVSLLTACSLENIGIEVCSVLNDWSEVESALVADKPDALLLSLDSNSLEAVVLAEKARKIDPHLGLVFLTSAPDLRLIGISEKELPHGVQVILKGSVIDLHVLVDGVHRSIQDLKNREKTRWVRGATFTNDSAFTTVLHSLTTVQIETLRLVALGSSNSEIARIRLVTEKAVEHTITRILQALSISANPSRNARVLLSREYYRWVSVSENA